jgi:hypothetical protein
VFSAALLLLLSVGALVMLSPIIPGALFGTRTLQAC